MVRVAKAVLSVFRAACIDPTVESVSLYLFGLYRTKSPPNYADRCRLIDTICPGSLSGFNDQVTERGPPGTTPFKDIQTSLAWPNAILTHLNGIGELIHHPSTRHSTVVLRPIKASKTETLVVLRSVWTAEEEDIDKKVVSHFLRTGRTQLVKAKEPPQVCLENSLAFENGTRDTIRSNKTEWMLASESIVAAMAAHGFVDPSSGSINANGRVFSAGPVTRRVIVEFDIYPVDNPFQPHSESRLVRWPFPREEATNYIPDFEQPQSSTNSSINQWR